MWKMKCPKCGGGIKWWPRELFFPSSTRDCFDCGEKWELTNPAVCSMINSLIFSAIAVGMIFVGKWVRYAIAPIACWLLHPFIVDIFGRWRSRPYSKRISHAIRKWSLTSMLSGWIFGVAATLTIISFALIYRDVLMNIDSTFTEPQTDAMQEFLSRVRFILPIGIGVSFIAIGACIIARITRLRLIEIQRKGGDRGLNERR